MSNFPLEINNLFGGHSYTCFSPLCRPIFFYFFNPSEIGLIVPQFFHWFYGHSYLYFLVIRDFNTVQRMRIIPFLLYLLLLTVTISSVCFVFVQGSKWWMESECPWQTLASCVDIAAAVRHPEGPQHYVSHFPVHQDGSCNGLQHYAALGRDEAGACSVNLMPQELPQDVYSCVAALVTRTIIAVSKIPLSRHLNTHLQAEMSHQGFFTFCLVPCITCCC